LFGIKYSNTLTRKQFYTILEAIYDTELDESVKEKIEVYLKEN